MALRKAVVAASLGLPGIHGFAERLGAAARHRFEGVEIIDDDLDSYAVQLPGGLTDDNRLQAARIVQAACEKLGLSVIVFQPFRFYEGLVDRTQHQAMIRKLQLWLKIAKTLKTTTIQLPTNWLSEGTTGDVDAVVGDLIEMADLGLKETPVIRFAYEAVAWGTHFDTWQGSWELVTKVNRPNFGLCLDTFHIAGRIWGDPLSPTGKTSNADTDLEASLRQLVQDVDVNKIFFVQVGDAEKLQAPLDQTHPFYSKDRPPRMSWSRNARLFAFEDDERGCLPIEAVVRAIVHGLGYTGWVSLELFSRKLSDTDPELPSKYAARAAASWQNMVEVLDR